MRRIAIAGLTALALAGVAAGTASAKDAAQSLGGTITRSTGATQYLTCPSATPYLKAADHDRGTVWDSLAYNTAGTDQNVVVAPSASDSVAWGHIGSRLATKLRVLANTDHHAQRSGNYNWRINFSCTDDQGSAWVIVG